MYSTEALSAAFYAKSNYIAYCCQVHLHTYTCIKYSLKRLAGQDDCAYRRTACWFSAPWAIVGETVLTDDGLLKTR